MVHAQELKNLHGPVYDIEKDHHFKVQQQQQQQQQPQQDRLCKSLKRFLADSGVAMKRA